MLAEILGLGNIDFGDWPDKEAKTLTCYCLAYQCIVCGIAVHYTSLCENRRERKVYYKNNTLAHQRCVE